MPVAHVNGGHLHYQIEGQANAPALVLSNSLATTFGMWDAQMPELHKHFRVLRYDTRGHGQSEVTPGPYSFEQLGGDDRHPRYLEGANRSRPQGRNEIDRRRNDGPLVHRTLPRARAAICRARQAH